MWTLGPIDSSLIWPLQEHMTVSTPNELHRLTEIVNL